LIYELLPSTSRSLPIPLQRKRFPFYLLDRLNYDEDSRLPGFDADAYNSRRYRQEQLDPEDDGE
jgi:hypothetical protein